MKVIGKARKMRLAKWPALFACAREMATKARVALKCERVNVNTTDATTGATALLLAAQNLIRDTSRVSKLLTKSWRVDKM